VSMCAAFRVSLLWTRAYSEVFADNDCPPRQSLTLRKELGCRRGLVLRQDEEICRTEYMTDRRRPGRGQRACGPIVGPRKLLEASRVAFERYKHECCEVAPNCL